jgi:hypothetical protein
MAGMPPDREVSASITEEDLRCPDYLLVKQEPQTPADGKRSRKPSEQYTPGKPFAGSTDGRRTPYRLWLLLKQKLNVITQDQFHKELKRVRLAFGDGASIEEMGKILKFSKLTFDQIRLERVWYCTETKKIEDAQRRHDVTKEDLVIYRPPKPGPGNTRTQKIRRLMEETGGSQSYSEQDYEPSQDVQEGPNPEVIRTLNTLTTGEGVLVFYSDGETVYACIKKAQDVMSGKESGLTLSNLSNEYLTGDQFPNRGVLDCVFTTPEFKQKVIDELTKQDNASFQFSEGSMKIDSTFLVQKICGLIETFCQEYCPQISIDDILEPILDAEIYRSVLLKSKKRTKVIRKGIKRCLQFVGIKSNVEQKNKFVDQIFTGEISDRSNIIMTTTLKLMRLIDEKEYAELMGAFEKVQPETTELPQEEETQPIEPAARTAQVPNPLDRRIRDLTRLRKYVRKNPQITLSQAEKATGVKIEVVLGKSMPQEEKQQLEGFISDLIEHGKIDKFYATLRHFDDVSEKAVKSVVQEFRENSDFLGLPEKVANHFKTNTALLILSLQTEASHYPRGYEEKEGADGRMMFDWAIEIAKEEREKLLDQHLGDDGSTRLRDYIAGFVIDQIKDMYDEDGNMDMSKALHPEIDSSRYVGPIDKINVENLGKVDEKPHAWFKAVQRSLMENMINLQKGITDRCSDGVMEEVYELLMENLRCDPGINTVFQGDEEIVTFARVLKTLLWTVAHLKEIPSKFLKEDSEDELLCGIMTIDLTGLKTVSFKKSKRKAGGADDEHQPSAKRQKAKGRARAIWPITAGKVAKWASKIAQAAARASKPAEAVQAAKETSKPTQAAKETSKPAQAAAGASKPAQAAKETSKPAQAAKETSKPAQAAKETAKPAQAAAGGSKPDGEGVVKVSKRTRYIKASERPFLVRYLENEVLKLVKLSDRQVEQLGTHIRRMVGHYKFKILDNSIELNQDICTDLTWRDSFILPSIDAPSHNHFYASTHKDDTEKRFEAFIFQVMMNLHVPVQGPLDIEGYTRDAFMQKFA